MSKQIIYWCLCIISSVGCFSLQAKDAPTDKQQLQQRLNEKERRKFDYFFYEGLNLKITGKYDAAFDAFSHCLAIDPTAAPVLFELANFYVQMERPDRAVDLLKRAIKNSENNFTYKITLANLSRELGMYAEASQEYEELVKEHPGKAELNYYLADVYTQQGEIEKAIDSFNRLEDNIGMNEAITMQKYKLYSSIKQDEKAFAEIEKLASKFPADARYPIIMGDLYLGKDEIKKAKVCYDKAYEIDPTNPYYIVSMANYYEHTGDKEAAETQIRNALVNTQLDIDTKIGILSRYVLRLQQTKQGVESADALFKTLLEQHPNDADLNMMYGSFLLLQNKQADAKFQFQLVTESDPEKQEAWQQLLSFSLKEENTKDMIHICERGIELFPEAPQFYFYLGIGYYMEKDYQKALETYKKGLKIIAPSNTEVISNFYGQIGDIYYQMGELDQAYAAYDEALKYNEKNAPVLNNYSYFLTLNGGDLSIAERMSAECIKLQPNNSTYLDTYAWVFFKQGNYTLAKLYIESALTADGEKSPEIIEHYGDILYKLGEKEKAIEQWKKAKEMKSESKTLDQKIKEQKYIEPDPESK